MSYESQPLKPGSSSGPLSLQLQEIGQSIPFWACVGCICIGATSGCMASIMLQYVSLWLITAIFILPAILAYLSIVMIIVHAAKTRR